MDITGNTILITGAGTGIGLEAAKPFDQHGNRLIMVARNEDRLEREAARLKDAHPFACDISDADQVDRKSTRLNSSHANISYAVFCLKKKKKQISHNHTY